ncbi:FliA/WhiG family RNA polymerase sigma factor [Thermosediminibacter oceani]|uniref:RNA polymerase sigma factor n=1 Tax=Thermosediminibacter oceani (strain ATCC BAA-1034 / DSM 16646 / JW/IW-1228P) TaxID=555079 RepID=D9S3A9_THEOJ|nr:FliA/WhiG family RNA polymerase sigma factor [Thermosediminibacter oceani]ADL07886.1 RNA polymerase, sigma 28 subunit, FliA/WhiG subfamily [Thermosediminibacter oceani DSM 16646]
MQEAVRAENLWIEYKNTGDSNLKERLIEEYIPLVKHIAARLAINLPPCVDYDDLVSAGIIGLLQAIERYDVGKGVRFETFAYTRIRGAMLDELRRLNWIPQKTMEKAKLLQDAYSQMEQELNGNVKDEDIARKLNITIAELHQTYKELAATNLVSLEEIFSVAVEDNGEPVSHVEKEEIKRILGEAIDRLPPKEKLVIALYYYEGLNLKEISVVLNLSPARISQLHTKAILRLRGSLSRKRAYFR